jgi:hypothetical protein
MGCLSGWISMRVPVVLLLLAASVFGQAQSADSADVEAAPQSAPVRLDGVTLFRVRGVSAFPAEKRAAAISDRTRALAEDRSFSPSLLRVVEEAGFLSIRVRDQMIMRVADSDAALESVKTQVLAQVIVGRIGEAVQEYRELRRPELLWKNAGKTALLSALLIGAIYLLLRLYRRAERWAERFSRRSFEKARMDKLGIAESDRVWFTIRGGLRFVVGFLILIGFLTNLNIVLSLFPWTRAVSINAFELFLGPLHTLDSSFIAALPNLTFLAVLFFIVRFLLKLTRLLFDAIARQTLTFSGFDPEWSGPTYRIARILIIAFGLIVAYPYLPGSGSEAFIGVSLLIGVIFSLGSSGAIANIIAGLLAGLLCFGAIAPAQEPRRIVAIGDVHGDLEQFAAVLRSAGLIDAGNRWSGGKTHLVQTGDIPDRGPSTRAILDLLMQLEKQAKKAGGAVHCLIGNHEAMNVYGDLRYAIREEFESFQSSNSESLRAKLWEIQAEQMKAAGKPPDDFFKRKWEAEHPLGWVEHRQAFEPGGKYHRWISSNDAVTKVGDSLFLHGGLSPKYADKEIKWLNDQIRSELRDPAKVPGGVAVDPEGPLWYRGLTVDTDPVLQTHVDAVLKKYGVKRIVIGHTPTPGAILPRFGGKVLMIDVGLSKAYGSRQACLLIEDGKTFSIHRGRKLALPDGSPGDLLRYLKEAVAVDPAPSPLLPLLQAASKND